MKKAKPYLKGIFLVLLTLFAASFAAAFAMLIVITSSNGSIYGVPFALLLGALIGVICFAVACVKKARGKLSSTYVTCWFWLTAGVFLLTTVLFALAKASALHPAMTVLSVLAAPLYPAVVLMLLMGDMYCIMIMAGVALAVSFVLIMLLAKRRDLFNWIGMLSICTCVCLVTYFGSDNYKYQSKNHGFEYMNGYSSVDLSDYTPYSESGKLAVLPHVPAFTIDKQSDMPVLDGAEACYPLYSAVAKTLYKDIDKIEKAATMSEKPTNGQIVSFTNTAIGYERLIDGHVDMFFGAKPSASQQELAKESGVELEFTPIGKEAFVFFVNENNPVEALSADQLRAIYHGDITNWKKVGGADTEIVAFQRPERSGSQSMMVYFMGDVSLKEPVTFEMQSAMSGITKQVAEYYNESGAIGYTFRYFLEGLNQQKGVKMLAVDGVYPTTQTIKDGSYPIQTALYCVTVKGNDNPNVQKVIDFLLSDDGQYLVEQSGYAPLK